MGEALDDFFSGDAHEEGLLGGEEVFAVAALEADEADVAGDVLDGPASAWGSAAVAVLADAFLVVFGEEVLVVVAAEPDRFRVAE